MHDIPKDRLPDPPPMHDQKFKTYFVQVDNSNMELILATSAEKAAEEVCEELDGRDTQILVGDAHLGTLQVYHFERIPSLKLVGEKTVD